MLLQSTTLPLNLDLFYISVQKWRITRCMFTFNRFKVQTGEIIIYLFMSPCHREDKVGMLCVAVVLSLFFRFAALNPIKYG